MRSCLNSDATIFTLLWCYTLVWREWYLCGIREQFCLWSVARVIEAEGYKTNTLKYSVAEYAACFKHLKTQHFAHNGYLRFQYDFKNRQLLFSYAALTDWSYKWSRDVFFCEVGAKFLSIVYTDCRLLKVNAKLIVVIIEWFDNTVQCDSIIYLYECLYMFPSFTTI
jgi:hypothetical protein